MNKTLISVPLNELRTNDEETLGAEFERDGKVYRWVKNAGTTGLVRVGSTLLVMTNTLGAVKTRVISPDGAGASTGVVTMPGGVPLTEIAPSGSATGSFGWVQVKGIKKVNVFQATTAATGGEIAVATSTQPSTGAWEKFQPESADSATTSYHYARRVQIVAPIATTGAATAVSAIVDIQCL